MPSAANGKSEKPASSEALDNSPIRQVITVVDHKIRNLEKRKGKLDQYRNLQKAGKDLEREQKVALTKWDEVNLTLELTREFSKQVTQIAVSAERDAKKQAKKDAWVRYAADTNKIREALLILDCLNMMGAPEVREDFLNGTNGAAKLTEEDLTILDNLYPEVTPKHEPNEEGQPGFPSASVKAAEHLCSITEGKAKEVLGTTYTHIKEIIAKVHECGYFDKVPEPEQPEVVEEPELQPEPELESEPVQQQPQPEVVEVVTEAPSMPAGFTALPVPPAPGVVPAPAYPLRPLPPITLQEVEHAYFAHQYPQQRPIAEVIGSQNFFFLQESELDSPNGTPQPMQPSPPQSIPSQTFTNQHFMPGHEMPQPHFAPIEHGFPPGTVMMPHMVQHPHQLVSHASPPATYAQPTPVPVVPSSPAHVTAPASAPLPPQAPQPEQRPSASPENDKTDDDWKETRSPERDDAGERRTQGQGDGQGRYRRYGGGARGGRGATNGHGRGRGSFRQGDGYRGRNSDGYQGRNSDGYQGRNSDGYQGRNSDGYQGRNSDGYQGRNSDVYQSRNSDGYQGRNADGNRSDYQRNSDGYQGRPNKERNYDRDNYQSKRNNDDGYYGNGDTGDDKREKSRDQVENGRDGHGYRDGRDRDGFKGRGRGGPRANRPPRSNNYAPRKQE